MLHALGNEPTALVMQTLGIFRLDAGNAHHAARRLAAQMTDQSTNHPVGIDPIVVFRDHTLVPPRPLRLHRIHRLIAPALPGAFPHSITSSAVAKS